MVGCCQGGSSTMPVDVVVDAMATSSCASIIIIIIIII